jgi:hypothetical protein
VKRHALTAGLVSAALLCGGVGAWSQGQGKKAKPEDGTAPAGRKEETKRKADKPVPNSLEEMLTRALRNNPDIRLYGTKVREAEAELQRARLQVTQKAVTLYHNRESQKDVVKAAEAEAFAVGGNTEANRKLVAAKAKLAEIEAEIAYLVGGQPAKGPGAGAVFVDLDNDGMVDVFVANDSYRRALTGSLAAGRQPAARRAVTGSMAEKIRKALERPVNLKVEQATLGAVMQMLQDKAGITIQLAEGNLADYPVSGLNLKDIPVGAALEAVEDKFATRRSDGLNGDEEHQPALRIAVRDYGLLVIPEDRLPPGAMLLEEFWKGDVGTDKGKAEVGKKAGY